MTDEDHDVNERTLDDEQGEQVGSGQTLAVSAGKGTHLPSLFKLV